MRNFDKDTYYTTSAINSLFGINDADVTVEALDSAKQSLIRQGYTPLAVDIDQRGGGSMRETWLKHHKVSGEAIMAAKLPRANSPWLPLDGTNAVNGSEYLTYQAASPDQRELMLAATLDRIGSILVVKMEAVKPVHHGDLDYHLIARLQQISLDGLQVGEDRFGSIKWYDYAPPIHTGRPCRCQPGW